MIRLSMTEPAKDPMAPPIVAALKPRNAPPKALPIAEPAAARSMVAMGISLERGKPPRRDGARAG
jgi:hypothetical protein